MVKKVFRLLAFIAVKTCVVAFINYLVFARCEKKFKRSRAKGLQFKFPHEEFLYKWRYGKARYVVCGSGEPVVLIHDAAVGGSAGDWEKIIPLLSRRHTVYAIDLLGYGLSDKPKLTYSSYLYASLINDFITDIVGEASIIVADGVSAGFTAAAYSFKPELYKKMIFLRNGRIKKCPLLCSRTLGRIIEIPVYGTMFYNFISSRCLVGKRRHLLSHIGGTGNKYTISALLMKHLYIDAERFAGKIKIPVVIIENSDKLLYANDPKFLYRLLR